MSVTGNVDAAVNAVGTLDGEVKIWKCTIEETTIDIDLLYNVNLMTILQTIPANGTKRILGVCLTSDGSAATIVSNPGSRVDAYGNVVWSVDITRKNSPSTLTRLIGTLHVFWID